MPHQEPTLCQLQEMQCKYKDISTITVKGKIGILKDIAKVATWLYLYDTKYTLKPGLLPGIQMDITTW